MKFRGGWVSNSSSTCFVVSAESNAEDIKIDIISAYLRIVNKDEDVSNEEISYSIRDYLNEVESYLITDADIKWVKEYITNADIGDIIITASNHGILGNRDVVNKVLEIKSIKGVIDNA